MRLRFLKPLPVLLICLLHLCSCKDFIEPDISKRIITPEAPANNFQSNSFTVNFWWDEVEDAISYRLQVVTPNFSNPGSLLIDTLVKTKSFGINLDPGDYQWRVRAENGSSFTSYSSSCSFTVLASSLTDQKVILSTPVNNTLTNQNTIIFKWGTLFSATKYRIQADTNNFQDENQILFNQLIPGQQLNYTFPKNQDYQWRVRAENETQQSRWSAISQITFDGTPPGIVLLNSPKNNSQLSKPVTLQWAATATASRYRLYLFQADSTTIYNSNFPIVLSATNYTFNAGNSGETVYWRVSAIDAAGNEGQLSEMRSFSLQ